MRFPTNFPKLPKSIGRQGTDRKALTSNGKEEFEIVDRLMTMFQDSAQFIVKMILLCL